ncbi:MAG: hypothetical protein AB1488_06360 [Nitrospirota bacterium]
MKTESKKQRPPVQAAPELLLPRLVDEQKSLMHLKSVPCGLVTLWLWLTSGRDTIDNPQRSYRSITLYKIICRMSNEKRKRIQKFKNRQKYFKIDFPMEVIIHKSTIFKKEVVEAL